MGHKSMQSFAGGIMLTTAIFGGSYLFFEQDDDKPIVSSTDKEIRYTNKEALSQLQKANYKIFSKDEWADYTAKQKETKLKEQDNQQESNKTNPVDSSIFQLHVESGMSSEEVIDILAVNDIIDSKDKFRDYLISRNLTTKIQPGTHTVTKEMGYSTITAIITKGTQ